MRTAIIAALAGAFLSACVETAPTPAPQVRSGPAPDRVTAATATSNFRAAVSRVEPVAESLCRQRASSGTNCDFRIQIDPNGKAPPNAFQSLDRSGRPILTFTQSLIAETRNQDEIAFVIGHESAHHIEGHIARQRRSATTGALVGGLIASVAGADGATVNEISRISAGVGARRFSKDHELEADSLGTVIAKSAGYDPIRGAAFFTRIPDPGDQFLGTHPPNAARIETVRRTAARL